MLSDEKKCLSKTLEFICLSFILVSIVVLIILTFDSPKINHGSVIVSNGIECAAIGKSIFRAGGSVADVAVATIICEGITCPQSAGLGGGFLMTIYIKAEGKIETLNAREIAPGLSSPYMFINKTEESKRGGKAVAVPGELLGLWELHQKYGKLPWKKLIEPNIMLARDGHVVSPYLQRVLQEAEQDIFDETSFGIFINPSTNKVYQANEKIKRVKLAKTLEIIADEGERAIYGGGSLTKSLIKEIEQRGGIMTEKDLSDYRVEWGSPLTATLTTQDTLYTFPSPGSGSVLIFILNLLNSFDLRHNTISYHRITEAFKFGYAMKTLLGDKEGQETIDKLTSLSYADEIRRLINDSRTSQNIEDYGTHFSLKENHGTAHISILASNGDAISVTSSINDKFGAFWRTESGIILNNHMDDFSTPGQDTNGLIASSENYIQPGKRPFSSMTPTIVLARDGSVKTVIGAAGGSRIISSVAFTLIKHLYMKEPLRLAIADKRIHHQLSPMKLEYEDGFDKEIINSLQENYGHEVVKTEVNDGFAAVVGISNGEGFFDPRRGGSVENY